LNGGPGAPAFVFVAERLQDALASPLSGWMGHAQPFAFDDDYRPAPGVDRFACGTPPMLSLLALEQGVDLMLEADLGLIGAKAEGLSELFIDLVLARCATFGLCLASPRAFADRGSHVSFAFSDAYALCRALIDRGVIGDFRAPDVVRFGFTPLYTRFVDVWAAAEILADVVSLRAWDRPEYRLQTRVT
jgi:kynureninase